MCACEYIMCANRYSRVSSNMCFRICILIVRMCVYVCLYVALFEASAKDFCLQGNCVKGKQELPLLVCLS